MKQIIEYSKSMNRLHAWPTIQKWVALRPGHRNANKMLWTSTHMTVFFWSQCRSQSVRKASGRFLLWLQLPQYGSTLLVICLPAKPLHRKPAKQHSTRQHNTKTDPCSRWLHNVWWESVSCYAFADTTVCIPLLWCKLKTQTGCRACMTTGF